MMLGRYEIKKKSTQPLQNEATHMAIKGRLLTNFLRGNFSALDDAGASVFIKWSSSSDIVKWSSGLDVTYLFQTTNQIIPIRIALLKLENL